MRFTLATASTIAVALTSAIPALALPATTSDANSEHSALEARKYVGPKCWMHLTQYQRTENHLRYRFDIKLYDVNETPIGGVEKVAVDNYGTIDVTSQLPYVYITTIGGADGDSLHFKYAGQDFSTGDAQCSVGKYDGGNRDMDCSFSC